MKPRMWIPNPGHVAASNFVRALFCSAVVDGRWRDVWPLLTVLYDLADEPDPPVPLRRLLRQPVETPQLMLQQIEVWAEQTGGVVEGDFMSLVMPNAERLHRWLRTRVHGVSEFEGMYTDDPATLLAFARGAEIARQVARHRSRTPKTLPLPLVIQGPTGAGKELLARALHLMSQPSQKQEGQFGAVNCGGLPTELIESELFGHAKGAFTGAVSDRPGVIEAHAHGSVFLDEIGDTPAAVQVRLLRFLNDGEIRRVGDDRARHVAPWVIAATHRDLELRTKELAFREDLLHRLRGNVLLLPALAARKNDVLSVLTKCIERRVGRAVELCLSEPAKQALQAYNWPGNLRELAQLSHSLANLLPDNGIRVIVDLGMLPDAIQTHYMSRTSAPDQYRFLYMERFRKRGKPDVALRDALVATYEAGLRSAFSTELRPALFIERIISSRVFAAFAGTDSAIQAQAVAAFRRGETMRRLKETLEQVLVDIDGVPVEVRNEVMAVPPKEDGLPEWIRHVLRLGEEASLSTSQLGLAVRQLLGWLDTLSPSARGAVEALVTLVIDEAKKDSTSPIDEVVAKPGEPSHRWADVRVDMVLLERYLKKYGTAVAMATAFDVNEKTVRDAIKSVGIRLPRGGARPRRRKNSPGRSKRINRQSNRINP